MSIKKFLFNGSEEKVSKSALDNDIVDELYPQLIATFTGYSDTPLTPPQCNVTFEQIAEAVANGVHVVLRHRDVAPDSSKAREVDLVPTLLFDNTGALTQIQGTHVDSSPMFATPSSSSFPYDTYINYTSMGLDVYGRMEGTGEVITPIDPDDPDDPFPVT